MIEPPMSVTDAGLSGARRGAARSVVEWVLHAVAVGLVAWAWWRSGHPAPRGGVEVRAQGELRAALVRWTLGEPVARAHARFDAVPDVTTREWLAALATTGTRVTWDAGGADALPATAIDVERVADPRGLVRVGVAAPAGARVVLADRLGGIDSVVAPHGMVGVRMSPPVGGVTARVGGTVASAAAVDSLALRRIYVVGTAGWEAKFAVRALEEEGWTVDAHLLVAPKNDVVPRPPVVLDTAHYAAIVAIDSAAGGEHALIERYVASGGGLVIAPGAAAALARLTAGGAGAVERGALTLADSAPLRGLTLAPVTNLVAGAVALARRDALVTVAARRVGAGRVVQMGYTDSWRWGMAAGDSAAAYRAWWAGLVAAVAYAPVIGQGTTVTADPAPLVATVERLGAPVALDPVAAARRRTLPVAWVFAIVVLALLGEWASRRIRGVR
ncbi:MAG TPA: hypothetical protein VNW46_05620 [Gemmatimonadaceae bacterium]|nr:hypothetical protein [Gemmatimonadaceae bacterium]